VEDPRLDALLDPAFLDGLESIPLDEVRARRAQCSEVEAWLSYFRRLVQGRLDIVLAEAHRRADGGEVPDSATLVDRLQEILSDHVRAPGNGRIPSLMMAKVPAQADLEHVERLDAIVDANGLVTLSELDEEQLRTMVDALDTLEREASATRRQLHEVMDRLQQELVRRYKSGEATVDGLLP
jgi:hypothetical protein